ncbi:hypothetical protein Taro_024699 [Colocasia esculenta]|uniref:Uncharacterized protein n=1 Tax=Colocasia esculenta TaxID=4460 RepID=A0A843VA38_COLES|nr:hypothetical protein [Colocasia esculenta]
MSWTAAPAAGGAPRSLLSPFPQIQSATPPSLEDQQQDEAAAAALAISDRRTLYLVNIFIGSAARFLNSFAAICEDKLADVHRRIVRLDATLKLLEAKLSGTSSNASGEGGEEGRKPDQEQQHHCSPSSSSSLPPPDRMSSTDLPTGG